MKAIIVNPPWITETKMGFRSNVRWPFMISHREFRLQKKALYHFPLYHAYTAALLRERGYSAAVLDAAVHCLDGEAFVGELEQENPDLIIMEISTPSFKIDMQTAERIKAKMDLPLVLIGSHATVYHEEILEQHQAADIIIRGEFEETVAELMQRLAHSETLKGLAGTTYRTTKGSIEINPPRPFIKDLDTLPYPALELYPWQRYHEPVYEALPWITMISSRGCPFQCIFCTWPQTMYGHQYRVRKPERVVDEMQYYLSNFQPGEIFFDDDTFTVDKKRVQQLCQEMLSRKISIIWSCMGRVDTIDQATLELMSQAGCRRIKFGIETGSSKVMDRIKKKINLATIQDAVRDAQRAHIKVHGTFMIGLPGETSETIEETLDFALALELDSAQFSIATPFPGTEFFDLAQQNGWLLTQDWSRFDGASGAVISYPHLSNKEIDSYLAIAWTKLFADQHNLLMLFKKAINTVRDRGLMATLRIVLNLLKSKNKVKTR